MFPYDKLQRGFANKQTTRNLRFSWCFAVKKGAKTFPRKLNWKTLANCVDKYRFRLKQWSRSYQIFHSIWILEISKMKLQTNELKRCQKRTLIKVLKTRKVSIQAGELNLVSPWVFWLDCVSPKYEPWLDQTRLICRRNVPKRYD